MEIDFWEHFDYREGMIFWKYSPRNNTPAGERAGSVNNWQGYRSVNVCKKKFQEHRVIWEMHNGPIPEGLFVDHIDQDPSNNDVSNLRLVTMTGNNRNRRLSKNNSSGCAGVRFEAGKWRARIIVNKKHLCLGRYELFEDAVEVRKEAERKYGFHENHGRAA